MENHYIVAQYAHRQVAFDGTFQHITAGDRANFRRAKHFAHFHQAHRSFGNRWRQHSRNERLHGIHHIVNYIVILHFHIFVFNQFARGRIRAYIKRHNARVGRERQVDIGFVDAADHSMHNFHLAFVNGHIFHRFGERLHRALHIGFDEQVERLRRGFAQSVEHIIQFDFLPRGEFAFFIFHLPMQRDFARDAFLLHAEKIIAGHRHPGQALNLHRRGRSRALHPPPLVVHQHPRAARFAPGQNNIAGAQNSLPH